MVRPCAAVTVAGPVTVAVAVVSGGSTAHAGAPNATPMIVATSAARPTRCFNERRAIALSLLQDDPGNAGTGGRQGRRDRTRSTLEGQPAQLSGLTMRAAGA